jgi:lysophospholipase L1-like esterase
MKNQRLKYLVLSFTILFTTVCSSQTLKFDFGPGKLEQGYTQILPGTKYSSELGYGFEFSSDLTGINYNKNDALKDDFITSDKPFYFSVRLPEGNYHVKVLLGDRKGKSKTTIKAECRRLMAEKSETKKGKFTTEEFIVHIRDSIIRPENIRVKLKSRESDYLHWDDKLTLEFNNTAIKLCAIEITPAIHSTTVFLAGNSTVVDQSNEPWAAWGQMFPSFFKPDKIAIANYAESGETLRAFKGEKRLQKIWSMAKPGDYLFIEFTHNDQKPGSNYLEAFTTYKETLKEWIAEARKRNMLPVLVTSMHRRNFDSLGRIKNTLGNYPEAMRQTGKEENVPVIDLNAMSKTLYEALGPEGSIKAFVHFAANSYPNQPKDVKDNTHFSTYGAYELAKCLVNGVKQNLPELAKYLKNDLPAFNPSHPDPFEKWKLPPSAFAAITKPDGN